MRTRSEQKRRGRAAVDAVDGKRWTVASSSATVCTTPLRCMIRPAVDIWASSILGTEGRSARQTRRAPWSLEMIYCIVSYDRATERMKGSLIIPPSVLGQVKSIAVFQPQDDGL